MCDITAKSNMPLDAPDQMVLSTHPRNRLSFTTHVTNQAVCRRLAQLPVIHAIKNRQLSETDRPLRASRGRHL